MFSIRQMVELTGLSEFTIRGWENRYSAFSPERSETGRREYDKKDIEKAMLIRELLKRDYKISKIANLSNQKLKALFETFEENKLSGLSYEPRDEIVVQALELMALQKWTKLYDLFDGVKYKSPSALVQNFFLPLLRELAIQVNSGFVSIAQEHILSSLVKEKIYAAIWELEAKKKNRVYSKKIRFVLAAPEGDHHEIGLLLAHLLVKHYGFTSLFLGPHTPSQDLSETALRFEASHLLIVSTISKKEGARQNILNFVNDIRRKLSPEVSILLAGNQVPPMLSSEPSSNLRHVESFNEFDVYLQKLSDEI